jgi:hypothetical protein
MLDKKVASNLAKHILWYGRVELKPGQGLTLNEILLSPRPSINDSFH